MGRGLDSAPAVQESPASLAELCTCLWRARLSILGTSALGLVLGALFFATARPRFRAAATILIEQENSSGLLGDLAMLASLASAPAAASELSVLESRVLAEGVVAEGRAADGGWDPRDDHRAGLDTLVHDDALAPLALVRRALFDRPAPDEPLVLPARGCHARVLALTSDAPTRIRLEFLDETHLALTTAGLLQGLYLAGPARAEVTFAPHARVSYRGLEFELEPWGECRGASFVLEYLPPHDALARLQERLEVRETALNSGVIEVALVDSDPRRAAHTVNALCLAYMDSLAARGQRRASQTVDYVQSLLDDEFKRFQHAQEGIMHLQQADPELIAPDSAATSVVEQLAGLEVERVQLELSAHTFQEIVGALAQGDAHALARLDNPLTMGVLADPETNGFLTELARLEAERSSLGTDLLDSHPLLAKNRAASASLLQRTREQLESRLVGVRSRTNELDSIQQNLRNELGKMPPSLRELSELKVDLAIHRELVPYLIKSLQGAEITKKSAGTFAELIDPAAPPAELDGPDPVRALALGLFLGLAAGIAWAFLRAPARGRVHSAAEFAQALGVTDVLALPRRAADPLALRAAPTGVAAEAIRALRAALRAAAPAGVSERRLFGLAPSPADRARAPLAAELALAFASEERSTLLIEADLRQPALAPLLGLERAPGLAQHLEDGAPWKELVQHAQPGDLSVLAAGMPARGAPGDLLVRPAMERLLVEARATYETVLLALPALESASEVATLARGLDVLCVVHRARSAPRRRMSAAAAGLRAAGVRTLFGVLLVGRP